MKQSEQPIPISYPFNLKFLGGILLILFWGCGLLQFCTDEYPLAPFYSQDENRSLQLSTSTLEIFVGIKSPNNT